MQFLEIAKDLTLSALSNIVGERNVDSVLNANSLGRSVNVGKSFDERNQKLISETKGTTVDKQTKLNVLNQFVGDSDIFEKAALGTEDDWTLLSQFNCFSDAIKIPSEVVLPPFEGLIGNGIPIPDDVYEDCTNQILEKNEIDPSTFSKLETTYTRGSYGVDDNGRIDVSEVFQWFKIPWGEVCLYSSLSNEMVYFPVYPEEFDDGVRANYDEMGEMLYQYEPWKVYKSSGPREISFTFKMHRDMWTGDHRDGNANTLIRACEANCYPEYNGSLVNVSLVTMYIHGRKFITGVMTDCKTHWAKPIGLDGFYLCVDLSFTIVEVSPEKLNYSVVKNKGLIE